MKAKIKIEQALIMFRGLPCVNVSVNINGIPVERFQIIEAIGEGFYIRNEVMDTRDNDCYHSGIEKAIKHIKSIITNRDYYNEQHNAKQINHIK
jgi:hypothetical protein